MDIEKIKKMWQNYPNLSVKEQNFLDRELFFNHNLSMSDFSYIYNFDYIIKTEEYLYYEIWLCNRPIGRLYKGTDKLYHFNNYNLKNDTFRMNSMPIALLVGLSGAFQGLNDDIIHSQEQKKILSIQLNKKDNN